MKELIPYVLVVAGLIAAAWLNKRGQAGAAISYLNEANRVLTRANTELLAKNAQLATELAAWKTKTDVTLAMRPLLDELIKHDKRAAERHSKLLGVIDQIAHLLGPEK